MISHMGDVHDMHKLVIDYFSKIEFRGTVSESFDIYMRIKSVTANGGEAKLWITKAFTGTNEWSKCGLRFLHYRLLDL